METKPVQNAKSPSYPTRRDVLAGAASFALFTLTGCNLAFGETEEGKITVAPIFKHGEGRGATGCIVVSPPVFLSEEEGMQILREELAKNGIQLKDGSVLEGVLIPHRIKRWHNVKDNKKSSEIQFIECKKNAKPLKLDGVDSEKHVAVEFVSVNRYSDLGGSPNSYSSDEEKKDLGGGVRVYHSSVNIYDFQETAEFVAAQVKKQCKDQVFFAVFYDPLSKMPYTRRSKEEREADQKKNQEDRDKEREEQSKKVKEDSKELLRLQAQDFVSWLKEQKAIQ